LFPTISDRNAIFDKFYVLSLTYRTPNGFLTMLMPLRDYLTPRDPLSSRLLRTTKDRYFSRMSTMEHPGRPGFREDQWIRSEDANVEYLLDVITSIDTSSDEAWSACIDFLRHLQWHKPRRCILGSKIEGLPDHHYSKSWCLLALARLLTSIGSDVEKSASSLTPWSSKERGRIVLGLPTYSPAYPIQIDCWASRKSVT
jgi:hypothetical protein